MGYVRLGKPGPRSSQPYAITAAGKRAFSRWLAESPGRDAIRNPVALRVAFGQDRKSTRLNSSHANISYAVFCLKKKKQTKMYLLLPTSTHFISLPTIT